MSLYLCLVCLVCLCICVRVCVSVCVQLQAEAKDGEIMHKAGREAVQHALAREDEGRRQEDKARKMDEKVRCEIKHKTAQSQYNSYQVCVFWSLISGCRRSETQAA